MASQGLDSAMVRSGRFFHLFTYGANLEAPVVGASLEGCELVAHREAVGTLYDIDGDYQALVLAGPGRVGGAVWRCPVELLPELDRDERVLARQLRRVGVQVGEFACWAYVVGPKLARRLVPGRRVAPGAQRASVV